LDRIARYVDAKFYYFYSDNDINTNQTMLTQPVAVMVDSLNGKVMLKCYGEETFLGNIFSNIKEKLPLRDVILKNGNDLR